ncbi:MAG: M1 family metallopeptidase [Candidatus Krumholzibacteria bacterium]|nr:M1 family metallopeptidase [Candidatus Krumholzibacteria bacterium]
MGCPTGAHALDQRQVPAPAPPYCKPALEMTTANKADFPPPPADSRDYDVLTYDLELRLEPVSSLISGQVTIGLVAEPDGDGAELSRVQLDLVPEMTVTSVTDRQGPLAFVHEASSLVVNLRQPLAAGQVDSFAVQWSGQPPRHGSFSAGLMFRTHDPGTPTDTSDDVPIVANLSQTWSAHSWWPCKDHPADKAQVSLAVTVPEALSAVSNGSLLSVTNAEPGWRRYAWQEAYPIPTYLVSVAVSNYATWTETCLPFSGPAVRLDYHIFPEDRAHAEVDLAPTCDMMAYLTEVFGPWPYPGEKYAQVEFKWIGGMEHTTASSLAQLLFTGDGRFENIFVHELVHQWFGDSLTPAAWSDIWLNEGFARYGEALWVEHRYGRQAYLDFMADIGPQGHPELFRGDGVLSNPNPILPNTLVYDKGAWVLHMLRELEGDAVFRAFLRDYANDPRLKHGLVTEAEMIAVAEAAAGRSLHAFFRPWLDTDLVPVISHTVRQSGAGTVEVTLTQHRDPVFEIPVPVVLHSGCAEVRTTLALTRAQQTFRLELDCPIDSVSIDPDGLALVRTLDSPPPALTVTGPAPNPLGAGGGSFMILLTRESQVVVNIYNIKGSLIAREDLGLLHSTAPEGVPIAPGHLWDWAPSPDDDLASGLYFFEFLGGGSRQVRPATLVR